MKRIGRASLVGILLGMLVAVLLPQVASAHVERPSYWPDPKPDCTISPCAGGKVPVARSLASSLQTAPPGRTRVVCKADSLTRLKAAVAKARKSGYLIRPTHRATLTKTRAAELIRVNEVLFKRCGYHHIQPAVTASRNNDRVVVMPGLYREPLSRAKPTYDPKCDKYEMNAESGDPGALTHDYQIHCPNDANLVAVIGRGPDRAPPPSPPPAERHGIPGAGPCIRCNVQLEGSGVGADDVIVEAGDAGAGNGGPTAAGHKKDVGIFVDRADGFVLRNLTVRHAREHGIYVLETDGYLLERFKAFYNGAYGLLTFVEDHGLVQHCEAAGSGDSGLYPGSGADSTTNRYLPFYPKARYSQVFRYCDSHHNLSGFSGTNSHGTLVTKNNFYNNALGYTTDVFTAPGHPGFPQHGNVVDGNNFYSNNYNPFLPDSEVVPFIPAPVGTGMWFAGGNKNIVRNNRYWDNWRRAMMLFAVPDATVCGPEPVGSNTPVPGCDPTKVSTSYDNRIYNNKLGTNRSGVSKPNGQDFWWDAFPGTTGNCWWNNAAAPGKKLNNSPASLPNCDGGTKPSQSIGLGNVLNQAELVACLAGLTVSGYPAGNETVCSWSKTPTRPGSDGGSLARTTQARTADTEATEEQRKEFAAICDQGLAQRLCAPYGSSLLRTVIARGTAAIADASSPVALARPVATEGRLSSFTCTWWRRADNGHRLGLIHRLRDLTSGPINGTTAEARYGYGSSMSDGRAARLIEDRCTTFHAGPFALYKVYGAAAAFSAVTK